MLLRLATRINPNTADWKTLAILPQLGEAPGGISSPTAMRAMPFIRPSPLSALPTTSCTSKGWGPRWSIA